MNLKSQQQNKHLFTTAIVASLALSFWIAYRESVINTDAICYLSSAESMGYLGFKAAMQVCDQAKWPFYSALIYWVHSCFHLSFTHAAYGLNGVFSLLSVIAFILIVKTLGGRQQTLWFAALIILLSHTFNGVREYIIRDHGFWAFYLLSLYFLLNYFKSSTHHWQTALLWSLCLIIATLFRIEGAIFLLFLPMLIWFSTNLTWRARLKAFLLLHLPTLLLALTMVFWLAMHPHAATDAKFGRVSELLQQFQQGFALLISHYQATQFAITNAVLTPDSHADAALVTEVFYAGWYIMRALLNLSWIYAILFLYSLSEHCLRFRDKALQRVVYAYIALNIIITFAFLLEHMFLSKRYLIALSLTFMLWLPFAIEEIFSRGEWKMASFLRRMTTIGVILAIATSALGGIFDFGYSKSYINEAGNWMAKNIPANAIIYTNDIQVMYYSHHFEHNIFQKASEYQVQDVNHFANIALNNLHAYDYLALRLDKKSESDTLPMLQNKLISPLQTFSNRRGDKVVIYRVTHEEKMS